MIDSITIHHNTIIDRGLHDSEGVRGEQSQNTLLVMGISYAGYKEGYNYRVNLTAGNQSHVLRYVYDRTGEPILIPEVNRLVDTFTSAGWQANTSTKQTQPDFGITHINTEITLTPGADAQSATTICASFITTVVAEAHARLESERLAKTQAMADSHTCTITQQVIWSIANEDWKLTAEHISQEFDGVGSDQPILYRLSPIQHGQNWQAFLYRHNGFQHEIVRKDYPLASKSGNRPTCDDPPVVHLETEMRQLLAQMKAQGWCIDHREESETSNANSLYYAITIRLVK